MDEKARGGSQGTRLRIAGVTRHWHAMLFIESRILRPHVRRPEARWVGRCVTGLEAPRGRPRRQEGRRGHREPGKTRSGQVTDGTVLARDMAGRQVRSK